MEHPFLKNVKIGKHMGTPWGKQYYGEKIGALKG